MNRERQQHVHKYSQYVNDLNRKSSSRSPTFGSPKGRFDAKAYKQQLQRKLMREINDEQKERLDKEKKNYNIHRSPAVQRSRHASALDN